MSEELKQDLIICGTGHRPQKLGGYDEKTFYKLVALGRFALTKLNPLRVITGGALGWDQALATAAQEMNVSYVIYIPFEDFHSRWPMQSRLRLDQLKRDATLVRLICPPGYDAHKLQLRNQAMVDDSEMVLALWDGNKEGGTYNCLRYAGSKNRPIRNLWQRWQKGDY